jgi:hypothetical protein
MIIISCLVQVPQSMKFRRESFFKYDCQIYIFNQLKGDTLKFYLLENYSK